MYLAGVDVYAVSSLRRARPEVSEPDLHGFIPCERLTMGDFRSCTFPLPAIPWDLES